MRYRCTSCGSAYAVFQLCCPDCGDWNSLSRARDPRHDTHPLALREIAPCAAPRAATNVGAFDRLLGGGAVRGSSILLIGPPGAGKSTLALQILKKMKLASLYVSGEESVQQLKLRAERLRIRSRRLYLLFEARVERIVPQVSATGADVLVIDSLQTMYSERSGGLPGSAAQLRSCVSLLCRLAQERNAVLFIIGQVTKENRTAGPRSIEHAVDVVLAMEQDPAGRNRRFIAAVKNRFGPAASRCGLSMRTSGLAFDADAS